VRFVDTSFWVALQFGRDAHHPEAAALWTDRAPGLLTSNHVLGESWTFLRRRLGHIAARRFVDAALSSPRLSIRHVEPSLELDAWSWLERHDERSYSFVDATSFALMRSMRISEAYAFDGDFAAAGFVELRL
jgi:predicted nucleic acid-binding protein